MAEPKKKLSHTRTSRRRSQYTIDAVGMSTCSHCHEPVRPHQVCPNCGYYRGQPTRLVKTQRITAAESPQVKPE